MKKIKQLLIRVIVFILSFGLVGCSDTLDVVATNEEEFIKIFQKTINNSLERQCELWRDFEKYSAYTQYDYKYEMTEVLKMERATLEENKNAIQSESLRMIVDKYIKGVNIQIDAMNSNEEKKAYYYEEKANELRKDALITMIENYDVKIKEDNKVIFDELLENVITFEKENKPQNYVDKLASEVKLEKIKDSFGDIKFLAVFENTSDLCFKNLAYKVEYKNENGKVVSYDYISIKNFIPGAIKEIKLTPYENEVVNATLITDWYETQ